MVGIPMGLSFGDEAHSDALSSYPLTERANECIKKEESNSSIREN